jgi:SnoaL-like polyketide cyclase
VGAANVLVECQPLAFGERVVGRHHADADVLEEEFVAERCGRIRNVEAQVESPAQDVVEHSVASRLDSKRGMTRELADLATDLMKEQEQRVIGRREAVVLLHGRRVEDIGGEQRLQLRHQTGELPLDALRPRGQDVAAAVANEELIVEQPAKSRERAAHRRLAETRPLRGPGRLHHPDMIAHVTGSAEPIYGREAHGAAMQQLVRMFPDVRVHTPYRIPFGGGDWITVVTNVTGTFTGEMTLPDGNVIPPTGKAFDLEFAQTSKWDGDQLIVISAFWDAALQAKQLGLAQ